MISNTFIVNEVTQMLEKSSLKTRPYFLPFVLVNANENSPQPDSEEQLSPSPSSVQRTSYASRSLDHHHDGRSDRRAVTETTHPSTDFNPTPRPSPKTLSQDLKYLDKNHHPVHRSRSDMELPREKRGRSYA